MLECVRDTYPDLKIQFQSPITSVDLERGEVELRGTEKEQFDLIVGADGAGSVVRKNIQEQRSDMVVSRF